MSQIILPADACSLPMPLSALFYRRSAGICFVGRAISDVDVRQDLFWCRSRLAHGGWVDWILARLNKKKVLLVSRLRQRLFAERRMCHSRVCRSKRLSLELSPRHEPIFCPRKQKFVITSQFKYNCFFCDCFQKRCIVYFWKKTPTKFQFPPPWITLAENISPPGKYVFLKKRCN